MASTARAEADCAEFFDDPKTLQIKIQKLAALIRGSKHFCCFTGAGISTAAGIADFRSGIKTALDTGAGKWAREAAVKSGQGAQIKKAKRKTKAIKAIPTKSHMALVALMTQGPKYLKHLISQNCDGLHRRSGIPVHQLSELHGNSTLEVCNKCSRGYIRDYRTMRKNKKMSDKRTGRYCTVPKCGGELCRTVVAFGQSLPELTFARAQENADECDVMLSLGSSLTVTPAADMCEQVGDEWDTETRVHGGEAKHHLVIVNLQKTPMDHLSSLRIFAKIDDVMVGLMRELELDIPEWHLQRLLKLEVAPIANRTDLRTLTVSAVDVGICATVFPRVQVRHNGRKLLQMKKRVLKRLRNNDVFEFNIPTELETEVEHEDADVEQAQEEHQVADADAAETQDEEAPNEDQGAESEPVSLPSPVRRRPKDDTSPSPNSEQKEEKKAEEDADSGLVLDLDFFMHYGEPRLKLRLNECLSKIGEEGGEVMCRLTMDVSSKQWTVDMDIDFEPLPVVKDTYSFTVKD